MPHFIPFFILFLGLEPSALSPRITKKLSRLSPHRKSSDLNGAFFCICDAWNSLFQPSVSHLLAACLARNWHFWLNKWLSTRWHDDRWLDQKTRIFFAAIRLVSAAIWRGPSLNNIYTVRIYISFRTTLANFIMRRLKMPIQTTTVDRLIHSKRHVSPNSWVYMQKSKKQAFYCEF